MMTLFYTVLPCFYWIRFILLYCSLVWKSLPNQQKQTGSLGSLFALCIQYVHVFNWPLSGFIFDPAFGGCPSVLLGLERVCCKTFPKCDNKETLNRSRSRSGPGPVSSGSGSGKDRSRSRYWSGPGLDLVRSRSGPGQVRVKVRIRSKSRSGPGQVQVRVNPVIDRCE